MSKKVLFLAQAGLIAAAYVVITVLGAAYSFGQVQVRLSEMLTILPFFTPAAIPGLFIGCIVGNILGGAVLPDVVFGSLATLAAAAATFYLRKKGSLVIAAVPPVVANALVVPFVLKYAYGVNLPIPFMMLTVGAGEAISAGVLGVLLGKALEKRKQAIFGPLSM
ncbi:MAG: QueT transporter family protein [Anaerovoracaceae bacterium]